MTVTDSGNGTIEKGGSNLKLLQIVLNAYLSYQTPFARRISVRQIDHTLRVQIYGANLYKCLSHAKYDCVA